MRMFRLKGDWQTGEVRLDGSLITSMALWSDDREKSKLVNALSENLPYSIDTMELETMVSNLPSTDFDVKLYFDPVPDLNRQKPLWSWKVKEGKKHPKEKSEVVGLFDWLGIPSSVGVFIAVLPWVLTFFIIGGLNLTGCATSSKMVDTVSPDVKLQLAKYRSYQDAYNQGYSAAASDYEKKVIKEVERIKGALAYRDLAGKGVIEEPEVVPIFIRGKTETGKLISPRIEWRITKPAKFVDYQKARSTMFAQRSFVYLGEFDGIARAKRWVDNNIKLFNNNDKVRYIKVEGDESAYAVIIETTPSLATEYKRYFENAYQIY